MVSSISGNRERRLDFTFGHEYCRLGVKQIVLTAKIARSQNVSDKEFGRFMHRLEQFSQPAEATQEKS